MTASSHHLAHQREAAGALFAPDGDLLVPTVLTQGPWDPDAQHGGPVAAALTRAVEAVPTLVPMQMARITFDLMRPVPLRPLEVRTAVIREGKQIQLVEAALVDGDLEVARALALRVRRADTSTPEVISHPRRPDVVPPPPPDGSGRPLHPRAAESPVGFLRAMEVERVIGEVGGGAPSVMWIRLRVPLVAGEATSPLCALAVAADFTSASGTYLDARRYAFINPDLNVHLLRSPVSDWIAVDASTWASAQGMGHSRAALFDLEGLVGTATAAQVVTPRPETDAGG